MRKSFRRLIQAPHLKFAAALFCLGIFSPQVAAQDLGSLTPHILPVLAHPDNPNLPAKQLFGRETTPTHSPPKPIGFYAHGCLAGAVALPLTGPDWQVMRPSRDRYWGSPKLIAFIKRYAHKVTRVSHWPGILIGDMAQPRGGPMLNGHASHQIGLDVDIWLKPMPHRLLSRYERERILSTNVVRKDRLDVDPTKWTPDHFAIIKAAAEDPEVQRIFVNAAIKKAICREAHDRGAWLAKVRPMYGHDYHFHVRLFCPRGDKACEHQKPVTQGIACDHAAFAYWFSDRVLHPRPAPHPKPRRQLTLANLPTACRSVLTAK
ncbi:MAG: penicillin-insensitive murein endopeptidase [Beijerinckiaceae bacterium]|nr:MAG: penicillin-insensitive murein endopeptidase [Beijerinckiaceae bacterium]